MMIDYEQIKFYCGICGREYYSLFGLIAHEQICDKPETIKFERDYFAL